MDRKKQQEAYENYVKQKTPVHNLPVNMTKAFITGGIICTIGQSVLNYCEKMGLEGYQRRLDIYDINLVKCCSYRIEYLSADCKVGRGRGTGSDYRFC